MNKLCSEIVKNVSCWKCGKELIKKKSSSCYIIKCSNKKCTAHVILVTKEQLDKLEKED